MSFIIISFKELEFLRKLFYIKDVHFLKSKLNMDYHGKIDHKKSSKIKTPLCIDGDNVVCGSSERID